MRLTGKCHCGNIGFTLEWPDAASRIPARACGCSFCVKHGGVWIEGRVYAVVSVNALENVDADRLDRAGANFEGEAVDSRLARRERNWIGTVRFEDASA